VEEEEGMSGGWSIGTKDGYQSEGSRDMPGINGSTPSVGMSEYDKAIEALARILRSLGRHAFKLDQLSEKAIEKEFEGWAMHVLVGTPILLKVDKHMIRRYAVIGVHSSDLSMGIVNMKILCHQKSARPAECFLGIYQYRGTRGGRGLGD
jgi:hypothetical protein